SVPLLSSVPLVSHPPSSWRTDEMPTPDDFRDVLPALLDIMDQLQRAEDEQPVLPPEAPGPLSTRLGFDLPAEPRPWAEVAEDLKQLALSSPRTTTPAFFNQLFGGRMGSATAADMLASLLNQSMYTYRVAGPQVLLEEALIRHMSAFLGWNNAGGSFAPGGSLSNLVAMVLARNAAFPETREDGLGGQRPVLYVSTEAHYSIRKNANLIGLGRRAVREIPVDERGRMRPDLLAAAVAADSSEGRTPFMVVATAGTTVRGSFDRLDELASVTESEGLWLHVDGAYGGSLILSERSRGLLQGAGRAQSFTWDAHKLMGVPLTCSVLLVPERGLLEKNLSEEANYLFQDDLGQDPGHGSLQCGRRNDGLKLWAAWQRHGDRGLASRLDRCLDNAARCAERVRSTPELELVSHESLNVCFTPRERDPESVAKQLADEGQFMVGTANVEGRQVIRWVAVNADVDDADVDAFVAAVAKVTRS
ncbi:MAG: pyridoxal-dependent decarboxylase, partial [Myxococcota bacterium]